MYRKIHKYLIYFLNYLHTWKNLPKNVSYDHNDTFSGTNTKFISNSNKNALVERFIPPKPLMKPYKYKNKIQEKNKCVYSDLKSSPFNRLL